MKKNLENLLKSKLTGIAYDSRKVKSGDVFVAIPGGRADGADFIPEAIKKGASVIVAEKEVAVPDKVDLVVVPNSRRALAELSAKLFDYPAKKLKIFGITGTNGKTTIAYLLESILKEAGHKVGLISTVEVKYAGKTQPSTFTTPESLELQELLSDMVKAGITHLVMEVSSHSLAQSRVHGLEYDVAIFTNLTHEHLDYHKSMDEYLKSKQELFKMLKPHGVAIVNVDDPYSHQIAEVVEGEVVFYGIREQKHELRSTKHSEFDVELDEYNIKPDYMRLKLDGYEIRTPLIGEYNIYNILAAFQCGLILHVNREKIKKGIEKAYVPGRFERIKTGQDFNIIVDFAHTPDGLGKVLGTVNSLKEDKARTILVFGCPGDRDKEKRPIMGKIAKENADLVIVTTDDPHTEDPKAIIDQVGEVGEKIVDRSKAIQKALGQAKTGDWVVIAGRGHEKYQDFNGKKILLDDREVVIALLK